MEEMMEDTLDSGILGEDEEELEEEAQGEVDKVLFELTDGAYRSLLLPLLATITDWVGIMRCSFLVRQTRASERYGRVTRTRHRRTRTRRGRRETGDGENAGRSRWLAEGLALQENGSSTRSLDLGSEQVNRTAGCTSSQ